MAAKRTAAGRPKKTDPTGRGEEALRIVSEILHAEDTKPSDRLAAAKLLAEYDLGKPVQKQENTNVNVGAEQTLSLAESLRIIRELTADG